YGRSGCRRVFSEQRRRSDHKARNPNIKLYVRNKRPEEMTEFKSEKTLLYVHGATQPAEATFDLPLEGLSWMDYIARRGWDVYLVDVRGYGASTPPARDGSTTCKQSASRHD